MRVMTTAAALASAVIAAIAATSPSAAFNAAQQYPYCSISTANSGMNCYIASPNQCDRDHICVPNPAYIGSAHAQAPLPPLSRR